MYPRENTPWAQFGFESVLIIVSILVAFSIDAWWDNRRAAHQKEELVSALVLDFETTRSMLAESIATSSDLNDRTAGFLTAVGKKEPATLESLRQLISGAFVKIDFEPSLSAFESAIATGKIELLDSPTLLKSITEFHQAVDYYELHDRIAADIFYLGPIWELRREVGSLRILFRDPVTYPERFRRSDEEYQKFFARPIVYAAIEVMLTAQRNSTNGLLKMDEAAGKILTELESLKSDTR